MEIGFSLILILFKASWVNSQMNITVLHLHDIYGNAVEAVKSAALRLNTNKEFNVNINLTQAYTAKCDTLRLLFKNKPLHAIIDTIHGADDRYPIYTEVPLISTAFGNPMKGPSNIYKIPHPLEFLEDLIYDLIKALEADNVLIAYNPNTFNIDNLRLKFFELQISYFFLEIDGPRTLSIVKLLKFNYVIFIYENSNGLNTLNSTIEDNKSIYWYVITTTDIQETGLKCQLLITPKFNNENSIKGNENDLLFQFYSDVAFLAFSAAKYFLEDTEDEERELDCIERGDEAFKFDFGKYLRPESLVFNGISLGENRGVYNFDMLIEKPTTKEIVGVWNYATGIKMWDGFVLKSFRNDRKMHYKILAIIKPPFVYYNPSQSTPFYGYCIDLIEELSELLGFTYELHPGDSAKQIIEDYDKYDAVLGGIRKASRLMYYIDFTEPFYKPVGIGILVKRSYNGGIFKFITVMESTVWLCVIGAYFLNSFMIWIFERFSPYSYNNNKERYADEDDTREFTLKESLWFCIMSITPQGGGNVPKHFSGRMAVVTWWIFGFIVLSSYTANLAAFLTLSKLNSDVESFEELSKQYKLQYSTVNNSEEQEFFLSYEKFESKLQRTSSPFFSGRNSDSWSFTL